MSQKELAEIQQALKNQKYDQALKLSRQITSNDPTNKAGLIMEISSLSKLSDFKSAISCILYTQKLLKEGEDDKLIFQLLTLTVEVSNGILTTGNQKEKKEALEMKIDFTKRLLQFYERKERYEKFQEELNELVALLTSQDRYQEIEQIYTQVLENQNFSDYFRHQCGVGIFTMSQFHKPKLQLTPELFNKITNLNTQSPDNSALSQLLMKDFEKNLDLDTRKQGLNQAEFFKTCNEFYNLATTIFGNTMDFNDDKICQNLFTKQLSLFYKYLMVTLNLLSPQQNEFKDIIENLRALTKTDTFISYYEPQQDTSFKLASLIQAMITYADSILVINPRNPLFESHDEQWQVRELSNIKKIVDVGFSPCEYLISMNQNQDEAYLLLNSGLNLCKSNLNLGFIKQPDNKLTLKTEQKKKIYPRIVAELETLQSASQNASIIHDNLIKLKYHYHLSNDDWRSAKQILDEIDQHGDNQIHPDWVKSQRAWLSYSSIDEFGYSEEDKIQIIKGCIKLLKESLSINPKNIEAQIRLGTLYYIFEKQLGLSPKSDQVQWIQALKQDPRNGVIYYCLGLQFYSKERDMDRAMKSLIKSIELNPDQEDAQYLLFQILVDQGNQDAAFSNLLKYQKFAPYSVFPQYYLGLEYYNNGDYQRALEYFQRGTRCHQYQSSHVIREKLNHPTMKDASKLIKYHNSLYNMFAREIGLFSKSDLIFWTFIADCNLKQDKIDSGMKCATKVYKDLLVIIDSENRHPVNILEGQIINKDNKILLEILGPLVNTVILPEPFQATSLLIEDILNKDLIDTLRVDLQKVLLVGSFAFKKIESFTYSLKILSQALKNINTFTENTFQEVLTEILDNFNKLVENKCRGQLDSQGILRQKCLNCLDQIMQMLDEEQNINPNQRFINVQIETLKILSELKKDSKYLQRAADLLQNVTKQDSVENNIFKRNIQLNLAKIYHSFLINFNNDQFYDQKIKIIRELIRQQTLNVQYWTYYGIFAKDQDLKLKCFYKSLSIDPQDQITLNNLFALYLRGNIYNKAIEVMNMIRKVEPLNPVVLALQIIQKARILLSREAATIHKKDQRAEELKQTISLGQMFIEIEKEKSDIANKERNPKLDIYGYFSDHIQHLILLMQYEVEDSQLNTYDFIDFLNYQIEQSHQYEGLIKCIKAKSQIITQGISSIDKLRQITESTLSQTEQLKPYLEKIKQIFQEFEDKDIQSLLQQHKQVSEIFLSQPSNQIATKLILINKILIKSQKNPQIDIVDDINEEALDQALRQIENYIASQLLIQVFQQSFNMKPENMVELQDKFYLFDWYRLDLEGHTLSRPEYGKIFKLYLLNQNPSFRETFVKEYKRIHLSPARQIQELMARVRVRSEINMSSQVEIMRNPIELKGYNKLIWHLFKTADFQQVKSAISMTQNKVKAGIISIISDFDHQLLNDYGDLAQAVENGSNNQGIQNSCFQQSLKDLIQLYFLSIDIKENHDGDKTQQLRQISQSIIRVFSNSSDQLIEDHIAIFYEIMTILQLKRGYLLSYNDVGANLQKCLKEQQSNIHPLFLNEINLILAMNMSYNYSNLRKLGQANIQMKQALEIFQANKSMNNTSRYILEALMKLKAKQPIEAIKQLELIQSTEVSYEKEFIFAQALYESKQFKNFYLACKALVASLKVEIHSLGQENPNAIHLIQDRRNFNFLLGFAYYLKTQAEYTFMLARKQGLKLEDDFDGNDAKTYNTEYLQNKASRSLKISQEILRDYDELVSFMNTQFHEI